jgi:predicted dehydrogenase
MTPLKVHILGSGNAARKHKAAYEQLPDMFSVVDSNPDIIDICTPNYTHAGYAIAFMGKGHHVIVEKPVAGSLWAVDELLAMENETGKFICPIAQYRYMPVALDDYFSLIEIRQPRDDAYYSGWRGKPEQSLGGCMTMFGIHIFDLLQQIMDVKRVVWAKTDITHHDIAVEDSCIVVLEMIDGGVATIYIDTPVSCEPKFVFNGKSADTSIDLFARQFKEIHKSLTENKPHRFLLHSPRPVRPSRY